MERYSYSVARFFLLIILLVQASACNRQGTSAAENTQKPKNIRLVVGKIKEVQMPVPADTTIQLVASSENNEIVDVSKQTVEQTLSQNQTKETFLIKAITPGTVKVTFSRKKVNEEGAGDITQTYLVRVVNK
ncbi:hypothetical protein GXP67_32765 [Rhodocytophaga rosea]|uniref:Protease inhibitor I42 family protein n=1 Tax=Rhodocytophaga rosea TaxID=2704465 RepID=A0A6C0GSJ5_9BACT|nr:hypothetical protein [Rhodocytophaga rosea]QHT71088.1 hypothetical protein GXP67_32765 [Rhodocytophaga rosea]